MKGRNAVGVWKLRNPRGSAGVQHRLRRVVSRTSLSMLVVPRRLRDHTITSLGHAARHTCGVSRRDGVMPGCYNRPTEIHGLLDRLAVMAKPITQRDATVPHEHANAARRLAIARPVTDKALPGGVNRPCRCRSRTSIDLYHSHRARPISTARRFERHGLNLLLPSSVRLRVGPFVEAAGCVAASAGTPPASRRACVVALVRHVEEVCGLEAPA
jgi:hypothetical protein